MKMFAAAAMLSSITSCASPDRIGGTANVAAPAVAATVTPDACTWLAKIHPDDGFSTRWTRYEKEQVVALNRKIALFCRTPH